MLKDPTYRKQARRLEEAFARVDGPGAAADLIQAMASLARARQLQAGW